MNMIWYRKTIEKCVIHHLLTSYDKLNKRSISLYDAAISRQQYLQVEPENILPIIILHYNKMPVSRCHYTTQNAPSFRDLTIFHVTSLVTVILARRGAPCYCLSPLSNESSHF